MAVLEEGPIVRISQFRVKEYFCFPESSEYRIRGGKPLREITQPRKLCIGFAHLVYNSLLQWWSLGDLRVGRVSELREIKQYYKRMTSILENAYNNSPRRALKQGIPSKKVDELFTHELAGQKNVFKESIREDFVYPWKEKDILASDRFLNPL